MSVAFENKNPEKQSLSEVGHMHFGVWGKHLGFVHL